MLCEMKENKLEGLAEPEFPYYIYKVVFTDKKETFYIFVSELELLQCINNYIGAGFKLVRLSKCDNLQLNK